MDRGKRWSQLMTEPKRYQQAEGKAIMADFDMMIAGAKARAYSKVSLERPLSDKELEEFREAAYKAHPEIKRAMRKK